MDSTARPPHYANDGIISRHIVGRSTDNEMIFIAAGSGNKDRESGSHDPRQKHSFNRGNDGD